MPEKKKMERLYYLDNAKAIAMFLVILGHCNLPANLPKVDDWIQSFHVPVYFVISGVLFAMKESVGSALSYEIKKKFSSYVIPFIVFSLALAGTEAALQLIGGDMISAKDTLLTGIINTLQLQGRAAPWFLMCLFIAELIFIFERKHFSLKVTLIINILLSAIAVVGPTDIVLIRSFLRAFLAVGCFTMGYMFFKYKNVFEGKNSILGLATVSGLHLLSVAVNGHTGIHGLDTGNHLWLFYPSMILGCMMFLGIIKRYFGKMHSFLSWFGANTLIVLCTQQIIIELLFAVDNKTFHIAEITGIIMPIVYCIITILLEIPVILIANRYFYFLFGKKEICVLSSMNI